MPFSEPSSQADLEAVINQALQAELDKGRNTDRHNEIMEFLNDKSIPELNACHLLGKIQNLFNKLIALYNLLLAHYFQRN